MGLRKELGHEELKVIDGRRLNFENLNRTNRWTLIVAAFWAVPHFNFFTLFLFTDSDDNTFRCIASAVDDDIFTYSRKLSRVLFSDKNKNNMVGFGGTCLDYLAVVANFPKPEDNCRSRSMKMQGGGDAANTLACAARLGLNPRLISKVAKEGATPFSYVIVDQKTKTRTCIFTPGHPPLQPDDLSPSNLEDAMRGASVVYFDEWLTNPAAFVAREVVTILTAHIFFINDYSFSFLLVNPAAARRNIPILLDAEKKREGLDDILVLARYAVCAAKFPQAWTEAPTIGSALVSMLLRLPKLKFVIVTLSAMGCIMLERIDTGIPASSSFNPKHFSI
ncbi:hypothetical protein CRG98_002825 [Punica granatum]|uniref:Carbohydrate kinase PfkB domain-containing protein n=1 Tax=Punica granatum TaxID=22663 RepID=A0A2I0L810_PUNGR|nr:hypothetical protein CRG98_002825 [Punica granatum]